jgi:hypothetical protein
MMTALVRIFAILAIDTVMSCLQLPLNIPLSGGLVEVSNRLTKRFFCRAILVLRDGESIFVPAGKPATNRRSSRYVSSVRSRYHDIPMKTCP